MSHGGPRKGSGRKPRADSRTVPKSIKVSQEVADYLAAVGTGIIEDLIRDSKQFREYQFAVGDDSKTCTKQAG